MRIDVWVDEGPVSSQAPFLLKYLLQDLEPPGLRGHIFIGEDGEDGWVCGSYGLPIVMPVEEGVQDARYPSIPELRPVSFGCRTPLASTVQRRDRVPKQDRNPDAVVCAVVLMGLAKDVTHVLATRRHVLLEDSPIASQLG